MLATLSNLIKLWTFLVFIAITSATYAQSTSANVNGIVTDEAGESIPFATVKVVNIKTNNEASVFSDSTGKFFFSGLPVSGMYSFTASSVGYDTRTISGVILRAGELNSLIFSLKTTENLLDQVVVVGYGTMKKSDLTGAAVSANLRDFEDVPNTNAFQSLQGSVAGLNVGTTTTSGATPTISIRGQNTLSSGAASNEPLIVVDGIIYRGNLNDINPNNIKSIDVLKDASSAAIYGSQSSNGVILITTKEGTVSGKPTIQYNGTFSVQTPSNKLQPLSGPEYEKFLLDTYWKESYLAPGYTDLNPNFDLGTKMRTNAAAENFRNGKAYDWWNSLTGNGNMQDHSVSISQRYKNFNYFISSGVTKQKGFIINDKYSRYSGQVNLGFDVTSWLNIGMESFLTVANYSGVSPNVSNSFYMVPWEPKYEADGSLVVNPDPLFINPFLEIQQPDDDKRLNLFGVAHAKIKVPWIKGLQYRVNYGQNYRTVNTNNFNPYGQNYTGVGTFSNDQRYDYTLDNILTYDFQLSPEHRFTLTGLYGVESRNFIDRSATAKNFQNNSLGYFRLQAGDPSLNTITTDFQHENSLYNMARLFYSGFDKYMLTATIRRDGFSGFGKSKKIGYFPSAAIGWVVSEEGFLKDRISWLNYLKLRASYGVTARRGLSRYETLAKVTAEPAIVFGDGQTAEFGQWVSSLANNDLTWETTTGLNVGMDFNIINSKVFGSIDVFKNDTKNILYNIQIPNITGFSTIPTNIGKVKNHGLDLELTGVLVDNNGLTWTSSVVYSRYRNEIVSILGFDNDNDGVEDDLISNRLFIGQPQQVIYDYPTNGIWQLSDDNDGKIPSGFFPGTYKIEDNNGDGQITPTDRQILGYQDPAYRIGWSNKFRYKDLTLFVFINAIQGGKDYYYGSHNPNSGRLEKQDQIAYSNGFAFDYWTPQNPNAMYRRLDVYSNFSPGVYKQRNFVRVQDVSLSYNARKIASAMKLNSLKLFVSGKNLLTFTKWEGWDPEVGGNPGAGLPVLRNYATGLNLEF